MCGRRGETEAEREPGHPRGLRLLGWEEGGQHPAQRPAQPACPGRVLATLNRRPRRSVCAGARVCRARGLHPRLPPPEYKGAAGWGVGVGRMAERETAGVGGRPTARSKPREARAEFCCLGAQAPGSRTCARLEARREGGSERRPPFWVVARTAGWELRQGTPGWQTSSAASGAGVRGEWEASQGAPGRPRGGARVRGQEGRRRNEGGRGEGRSESRRGPGRGGAGGGARRGMRPCAELASPLSPSAQPGFPLPSRAQGVREPDRALSVQPPPPCGPQTRTPSRTPSPPAAPHPARVSRGCAPSCPRAPSSARSKAASCWPSR